MKSWSIYFGENEISRINSSEELETEIRKILNSFNVNNPMIALINPKGDAMTIGLSKNVGFLNYVSASGDPPYYSSVSNKNLGIEDGLLQFICGEVTEIPVKNCIPIEVLIKGLKEYFESEKLPSNIEWEAD